MVVDFFFVTRGPFWVVFILREIDVEVVFSRRHRAWVAGHGWWVAGGGWRVAGGE